MKKKRYVITLGKLGRDGIGGDLPKSDSIFRPENSAISSVAQVTMKDYIFELWRKI